MQPFSARRFAAVQIFGCQFVGFRASVAALSKLAYSRRGFLVPRPKIGDPNLQRVQRCASNGSMVAEKAGVEEQ